MTYLRGGEGTQPGKYKVAVSKRQYPKGKEIAPGQPITAEVVFKELLPPSISDPSKTTVVVNVPQQGGVINLDLEDKGGWPGKPGLTGMPGGTAALPGPVLPR